MLLTFRIVPIQVNGINFVQCQHTFQYYEELT